jgi:putative membrane protein
MLYVLGLILAGSITGIVAGLIPGIHVNTLCLIGLGLYPLLGVDPVMFALMMVSATVTQNFIDFIPAIFLGIPDSDTALSILPTHRLVIEGRGLEAVKLTCLGCLLGMIFGVALIIPAAYIVPRIYGALRDYMGLLIMAAALALILGEKNRVRALIVFGLSGVFGMRVLYNPGLSPTYSLFPAFVGLFGFAGIIHSLFQNPIITAQKEYARVDYDGGNILAGLVGAIGGITVGLLPSLSPSQFGILSSRLYGEGTKRFLITVAAINTSDAIYSLIALYTINNPRSGVAVMISKIIEVDSQTLALFTGAFCMSALIATVAHIGIGKIAVRHYRRVDYKIVSKAVLAVMTLAIYAMTGFHGLIIAAVATSIGLTPIYGGVSRTHLMGCLMMPTILYFLA